MRQVDDRRSKVQFLTDYVERASDRIQVVQRVTEQLPHRTGAYRHLFQDVFAGVAKIGGRNCQSPLVLLRGMASSHCEVLRPRSQGTCSHGDLTILNILYDQRCDDARLIDPRGTVGPWDPLYDIGKLLFSLNGFSHIVLGAYELDDDAGGCGWTFRTLGEKGSFHRAQIESAFILERVRTHTLFERLRELEPYWHLRLRFAEACHFLADVPYRFAMNNDARAAAAVLALGTELLAQINTDLNGGSYADQ